MSRDLGSIYTAEWYAGHASLRNEYHRLADILADAFGALTALDVGCGCGYVIERLDQRGMYVHGIDGSPNALAAVPASVRKRVSLFDIESRDFVSPKYGLVICTEVAEHLPAIHASRLVRLLCECAFGPIFFTAATPGQGGHDHINEQPPEYWTSKFFERGKTLCERESADMRETLGSITGMPWFAKTSMVFR